MEHYSLRQQAPAIPAPPGTRVILVRVRRVGGGWQADHEVLPVVAFQTSVVHHYVRETVAPVYPTPALMERHGWEYQHPETRYSPVFLTATGKLSGIDPDDPRWSLVGPEVPADRVEALAETLKADEVERQEVERLIEEKEEAGGEVEED